MTRSRSYQRRSTHAARVKNTRLSLDSKTTGGHDLKTHHLLDIREPPNALVALRNRLALPEHKDILEFARANSSTFEEGLGAIAAALDIILDGDYNAVDLIELLVNALDNRSSAKHRAHKLDPRLVNANLVEREDSIEIEAVDEEAGETTLAAIPKTPSQRFMEKHGCLVCESINLCMSSDSCLGPSGLNAAIEEGLKE